MLSHVLVDVFQVALPFLYAALVGVYALAFFRNARSRELLKTRALAVVLVCHLVYLIARTIAFDHPPHHECVRDPDAARGGDGVLVSLH
jgi:hypothetical protein